jgi:hypothetical protein
LAAHGLELLVADQRLRAETGAVHDQRLWERQVGGAAAAGIPRNIDAALPAAISRRTKDERFKLFFRRYA